MVGAEENFIKRIFHSFAELFFLSKTSNFSITCWLYLSSDASLVFCVLYDVGKIIVPFSDLCYYPRTDTCSRFYVYKYNSRDHMSEEKEK